MEASRVIYWRDLWHLVFIQMHGHSLPFPLDGFGTVSTSVFGQCLLFKFTRTMCHFVSFLKKKTDKQFYLPVSSNKILTYDLII